MTFDFLMVVGASAILLGTVQLVWPQEFIRFQQRHGIWGRWIADSKNARRYTRFQGLGILLIGMLALAVGD